MYNNENIFVILEVIPNHNYKESHFLKSTEKTKKVEIKETEEVINKKSSILLILVYNRYCKSFRQ